MTAWRSLAALSDDINDMICVYRLFLTGWVAVALVVVVLFNQVWHATGNDILVWFVLQFFAAVLFFRISRALGGIRRHLKDLTQEQAFRLSLTHKGATT